MKKNKYRLGLLTAVCLGLACPGAAASADSPGAITRPLKAPRVISSPDSGSGSDDLKALFEPARRETGRQTENSGLVSARNEVRKLAIPRVVSTLDANGNGINDTDDLIEGARLEAGRKPIYKSAYYMGGHPPETEGVCTDVIWRAFAHAGYDLKKMIDADIKANVSAYPRTGGKPDPHIDFRRVPNQRAFFRRHGLSLTTTIDPDDAANLAQWQPGDIVTFQGPDHIAILSDRRNKLGIPYLLHNDGPWASEGDDFLGWYNRGCTGHFRYPKK